MIIENINKLKSIENKINKIKAKNDDTAEKVIKDLIKDLELKIDAFDTYLNFEIINSCSLKIERKLLKLKPVLGQKLLEEILTFLDNEFSSINEVNDRLKVYENFAENKSRYNYPLSRVICDRISGNDTYLEKAREIYLAKLKEFAKIEIQNIGAEKLMQIKNIAEICNILENYILEKYHYKVSIINKECLFNVYECNFAPYISKRLIVPDSLSESISYKDFSNFIDRFNSFLKDGEDQ